MWNCGSNFFWLIFPYWHWTSLWRYGLQQRLEFLSVVFLFALYVSSLLLFKACLLVNEKPLLKMVLVTFLADFSQLSRWGDQLHRNQLEDTESCLGWEMITSRHPAFSLYRQGASESWALSWVIFALSSPSPPSQPSWALRSTFVTQGGEKMFSEMRHHRPFISLGYFSVVLRQCAYRQRS